MSDNNIASCNSFVLDVGGEGLNVYNKIIYPEFGKEKWLPICDNKIGNEISYGTYGVISSISDKYLIYDDTHGTVILKFYHDRIKMTYERYKFTHIHNKCKYYLDIKLNQLHKIKDKKITNTYKIQEQLENDDNRSINFYHNFIILSYTCGYDIIINILNYDLEKITEFKKQIIFPGYKETIKISCIGKKFVENLKIIKNKLVISTWYAILSLDLITYQWNTEYEIKHEYPIIKKSLLTKYIFYIKDGNEYYIISNGKKYNIFTSTYNLFYNQNEIIIDGYLNSDNRYECNRKNLIYNRNMQLLYCLSGKMVTDANNTYIILNVGPRSNIIKFKSAIKRRLKKLLQNNDYFHILRLYF